MSAPARLRIGISGWRYAPWRGDFYPEGLRQKDELRFASRAVNSIEINGTFYALQTPERFRGWAEDTPEDFVFSVKAPRYITHVRRLREIDEPLANFFASGPLALRQRLGPFLWQFPPSSGHLPAVSATTRATRYSRSSSMNVGSTKLSWRISTACRRRCAGSPSR